MVSWAGSAVYFWLKKTENIHIFFNFSKNFSVGIFLVIGVKPGKSSEMGEKIKRLNSESWEVETK